MLRTLVLVLALGAASPALAQQHPDESAVGIDVVGDDGTVIGHVTHVQRDRRGRIVSAEIPGQEPGSAPQAPNTLVADNGQEHPLMMIVRDCRPHPERLITTASAEQIRAR